MIGPTQITALSWRVVAAVSQRVPDIQVFHLHPGGGQYDVLSIRIGRSEVADLNRNGRIHISDQRIFTWDDVFVDGGEACVSSIVAVADRVRRDGLPNRARVVTYSMIAALLERSLAADNLVYWDVEAAMFDAPDAVFVRREYLFGQRVLVDADPYEVWCLKANGEPVLSVYDGHGWTASGTEFHWESCDDATVNEAMDLIARGLLDSANRGDPTR